MAEPVRNPETGGRSLADILREAGIENPSRSGRRRRWDDVDDTGIRQRDADGSERPVDRGGYGRRASDVPLDRPAPVRDAGARDGGVRDGGVRDGDARDRRRPQDDRPVREPRPQAREDRPAREERAPREDRREDRREERRPGRAGRVPPPEHSTAAIPGLRPSRQPSVPGAAPAAAVVETPVREHRTEDRRTEERRSEERRATDQPVEERRSAQRRLGQRGTEDRRAGDRRAGGRRPADQPTDAPPATGRIPAIHDDALAEDLDAGPKESALAWLRFGGELVIAAAVGVGIYFAFTVLWQTLPHLAVLAAPLAVTGLVAGVSAWRQRLGHAHVGARLLAVLVFAGTLLTVLPAAGLINGN